MNTEDTTPEQDAEPATGEDGAAYMDTPAYSQGYLDGMEDGVASAHRVTERRRTERRRVLRLAVAGVAAWVIGSAVGDTITTLARWVES